MYASQPASLPVCQRASQPAPLPRQWKMAPATTKTESAVAGKRESNDAHAFVQKKPSAHEKRKQQPGESLAVKTPVRTRNGAKRLVRCSAAADEPGRMNLCRWPWGFRTDTRYDRGRPADSCHSRHHTRNYSDLLNWKEDNWKLKNDAVQFSYPYSNQKWAWLHEQGCMREKYERKRTNNSSTFLCLRSNKENTNIVENFTLFVR